MLTIVNISLSAIVVFVSILSRDWQCKSTNKRNKLLHGWFLCTILIILWFWRITYSPVFRSFVCDCSQLVYKNRYALTNHEVISISYISSNFMFSDIDECSTNDHSCDVNAVCTNTVGSYACACKAGYTGDGRTCNGTFVCLF